jgi:class 3 adenylate cyclase
VVEVPDTRFVRSRAGSQIAYQVVGDGPRDVLVTSPTWIPIDLMWDEPRMVHFLQWLSSFSRSIWFDFRGIGASAATALTVENLAETWVEDMALLADEVGCEKVVVLQTSGGPIAPLFAATHPQRTSALVLLDVSARFRRDNEYPQGFPDEMAELALERAFDVESAAPSLADDLRFRRWYERALRLAAPSDVLREMVRTSFDIDGRSVLPTVQAPTLVVARRNTLLAEQCRYVAEHIPAATFVEWDGVDRLPFARDSGSVMAQIEEFVTGERPGAESDRVLATVLFTDLVSSTARLAEIGDRQWRNLLAAHDALVQTELDRFHGRQVNHTGDGVVAVFDGPARAVRCATAIRDAISALGLEIRAGVHTGEIEVRGDDIAGLAVHIGQRVSAIAAPGEIIVSRTVADLITGSSIELVDRGEHELKGVPGTWRVSLVRQA